MQDDILIFSHPNWWLIIAAIVAAGLSWILYSKKNQPWSVTVNWLLATLRFLVFFLLFLLFLDPIANLITYSEERPVFAVALDNSSSMLLNNDSSEIIRSVTELQTEIENQNYRFILYDLQGPIGLDEIRFDEKRTNLNQQLKNIERDFENQNLAAIVEITDGIVNSGYLPSRSTFGKPIYTVGMGDTIPPRDVRINSIEANDLVYQGNLFNVKLLIAANGFEGQAATIQIGKNGQVEKTQEIKLTSIQEVNITLEATSAGLYRYSAQVSTFEDEASQTNNQLDFYVDVIEGKENILIAATAAHPDIRAIRSALSQSENYETFVYIQGLSPLQTDIKYDVLIYHNAFERGKNIAFPEAINDLPTLYIINEKPDVALLSNTTQTELSEFEYQKDEVVPGINDSFSKFKLSPELLSRANNYPSIGVPYATYQLNGPHEILLFQKVGRIATGKPLLSFYDDGDQKHAVLMGKGIWKWKLQEAAISGDSEFFNEIILKTTQYLSIRNDKKRFSAVPADRIFETGKPIGFNVEIYDQIYERINGQPFQLLITNQEGSTNRFDFTSSSQFNNYSLGSLPSGSYEFRAITSLEGKTEQIMGQFLVKEIQLESIQHQANHLLLRQVSKTTNGQYFHFTNRDALIDLIKESQYPGIIRNENDYFPLRKSIWILALIIFLSSLEWFLRKYLGSY